MEKITKPHPVTVTILLLVVTNDLIDTSAQLLMKKGLGFYDPIAVSSFIHHLFNFNNPLLILFWAGLVLYISNFFIWMKVLSKIDLSVALPLASAGYILIPLASIFFLHEFIPPLRWLGLVLIVLGIYFVSRKSSEARHE